MRFPSVLGPRQRFSDAPEGGRLNRSAEGSLLFLWLLSASVCGLAAAPWDEHGRLELSPDRRFLQHADGTPFLWIGDTAWALFYKLNREQVVSYLDHRASTGFNVIQAVAYWYPHGEDGPGPLNAPNAYGHRPFHGDLDAPDTARPLSSDKGSADAPEDYWDHADFIVRETRRRGLVLALLPCWGRAMVQAQMENSRVEFTEDEARSFGRFLGERYGREPHVLWVLGGDANATQGVGDQRQIYRSMAEGLGQGATGETLHWDQPHAGWDRLLMTYHPDGDPRFNSSSWFHADAWLDAHGIETWKSIDQVYSAVARDAARDDPVRPTLLLEGAYEGGTYPGPGGRITALKARQQAYHTFLAGGAGHTYGAFPMWDFTRDPAHDTERHTWEQALAFPAGPQIAQTLRRLLDTLEWWTLAPDPSLVVDGRGQGVTFKAAARARNGNRIVVYYPEATPALIRLHALQNTAASVVATWHDPRTGGTKPAGVHPSAAITVFEPPRGWEDALLVIEATQP